MEKETKKKKVMEKAKEVCRSYVDKDSFRTDPNGSYTGRPADEKEIPVQDADDL